jgi:hypothetical protein
MLLTEAQSARAVGGLSVALGAGVALAPARLGKLLGAEVTTGQDRYLGRQIGLDLAALGAVLLTAAQAQRKGSLMNVVASAAALSGVTAVAMAKGDIPRRYATRMLAVSAVIAAAAGLPLVGNDPGHRGG